MRTLPLPDNAIHNQLEDLPLGDQGIVEVEAAILPLDGTVDIKIVAQPVVRGAPEGTQTWVR